MPFTRFFVAIQLVALLITVDAIGDDAIPSPACSANDLFRDAWIKVGQRVCLKCHTAEGDAADSDFILQNGSQLSGDERRTIDLHNENAFTRMARRREKGLPRLLAKATGGLDHGGGAAIKVDSSEFDVLRAFVRGATRHSPESATPHSGDDLAGFYDGVEMLSSPRLLRRLTLSLASRLPTPEERQKVNTDGLDAIDPILTELMTEDAFYQRLQEGFNDIFLTLGYNGTGESVLSYNHFQPTRHWYQKHSLDHIPEKERQRARYKLADQYREALRREPLELLRYIVENDRPFSETLTADFTMVSPYTARGYGLFKRLKDQFDDPDDPFEYIPARLDALTHRNGKTQPTADGVYPHAGLLSMFQYLRRYPTTETNRNRLRARMYFQHFLGVDIMSLAPRVSDAAAIDAEYEVPTMQAAECVVCHRTIDPIAGLFQDYYNEEGHYGPRKDGWFEDMFSPGREGVELPESERWRALPWLAEQTVTDPRFPVAISEHVYYILTGRKVLLPPEDIDDPHFANRRRAFLAQRELIERAAEQFSNNHFNLKVIFKELAVSPWYRADGLSDSQLSPERRMELEDVGVVRLLGPEQLERKIVAIFGQPWGRLNDSYAILYGGIDSQEVTERLTDPSGAIGALQRIMANHVACKNVSKDFALPASERRLFPGIEPEVVPDSDDPLAEPKIRAAIVHLHQHILGREDAMDAAEVDQTYQLFCGIVRDAAEEQVAPVESYFCKSGEEQDPRDPDPHYTMRAWRGVVTYLLRQQEFVYE